MRLTPEDALIIDLLLDGNVQLDEKADGMQERLQAAQKVLHVLDAMPAIDPSTHLIDQTLHRVEDAAQRVSTIGDQEGVFIPPTGPHAS